MALYPYIAMLRRIYRIAYQAKHLGTDRVRVEVPWTTTLPKEARQHLEMTAHARGTTPLQGAESDWYVLSAYRYQQFLEMVSPQAR